VDAEGYCERCGLRQPTGRDHAELELAGGAAGVTDRGLRRARNEDAMALLPAAERHPPGGVPKAVPAGVPEAVPAGEPTASATTGEATAPTATGAATATAAVSAEAATARVLAGGAVVAVVCDGVGSSPRADEASAVAVETAAAALARGLPHEEAFALAKQAVVKLAASEDDAPASTYVAAVAEPGRVTLCWAGDSRAYWLPGGTPLTEDDAAPTGEITVWLGADYADAVPRVRTFVPSAPGSLLICSDGLWRYLDGYRFPTSGTPLEQARQMLRHALDSGGQDNVTIVVIPLGGPHG
jgi:serine/threonine protein phosphatase PrpC